MTAYAVEAASWRGPDGGGWPLWVWLAVLCGTWLVARAFFVWESALLFVPPALAVALAFPIVKAVSTRVAESKGGRRLRKIEPLVAAGVLAVITVNVFWFAINKKLPIDINDNQMYIARAEILARALAEGRLPRWSHLFQGGDPQTDLYPYFANLLVAVLHRVWLSDLPIAAAYTAVSLASWWLRGLTVYLLARRFTGPVVSAVLAMAALLDIGQGIWDGTWHPGFFWGLIHSNISLSFCLAALALQIDCLRSPSGKRLLGASLLVAVGVFAHPIGLVIEAAASGALLITLVAARTPRRNTGWAIVATALGLLLAAVWIIPQTHTLATYGFGFAAGGESYVNMGSGLLDGSRPGSSYGAFVGLALVAVTAALTLRRAESFFPAMATTALWCLALEPLAIESQVLVRLPSLLGGQLVRLLVPATAFAIAPIAWLLSRVYEHLRWPSSLSPMAVVGRAVVSAILLLGPARSLGHAIEKQTTALRDQFPAAIHAPWRSTNVISPDLDAAFEWLRTARTEDVSPTPWRISVHTTHEHQYAAWTSGVHTGVPVVQYISNIVGMMIGNRPRELSPSGLRDWNVRYVLTEGPRPPVSGLIHRFTAGNIRIWEVADHDDRFVLAPEGIIVRNLHVQGDRIRFEVQGAPPGGVDVNVRVAWYPRWRARQDGHALQVRAGPPRLGALPKQDQVLLHVGNGKVELTCDGSLPGTWPALCLTILAMAAMVWFGSNRRMAHAERLAGHVLARLRSDAVHCRKTLWQKMSRNRKWAAVFITSAIALVVLAAVLANRKQVTMTPISNAALRVSARIDKQPFHPCTAAFWAGRYVCRNQTVIVEPALVAEPVQDQSGEWDHLRAGIAVNIRWTRMAVRMEVPRTAIAGRTLELESRTDGSVKAVLRVGGRIWLDETWSGYLQRHVTFPSDLPRTGTLEWEFTSKNPARVVLRGASRPAREPPRSSAP